MELNSLPKGEVESLSPKTAVSKGETCQLSEASPPTKWNAKGSYL